MRGIFIIVVLAFCSNAFSQERGIGLRLGNPIGVYYKQYLPNDKAFELGIGTAPPGWNANYYENSFDRYNKYDGYDYKSSDVGGIVYFQARYLIQYEIPIEGMEGNLGWYWGVGALLKFAAVEYTYQNRTAPFNVVSDDRTDIDLGPEGIAGMEYTFQDIPLTVFGEVSLLLEFADRPFAIRPLAGIGARFNF